MKNLRRSRQGLSLAAVLCLGMLAAAWQAGASPYDALPTMDVVRSKLELSPEQETQLRPLFEQRIAELQQIRGSVEQAATKADKRAVLRDAKQKQKAFNSSVESLLSPSQKTKWRELQSATREKLKQRYEDKRESGG
jgi:hypothetical protein